MTLLAFRNIDVDPLAPVSTWPHEAFQAAIERGYLPDWQRIAHEIIDHPYGEAAATLAEVLEYLDSSPAVVLLGGVLTQARAEEDKACRRAVANRVKELVVASGVSASELARLAGTSKSRLSTWVNGTVSPAAATLEKLERIAAATISCSNRPAKNSALYRSENEHSNKKANTGLGNGEH